MATEAVRRSDEIFVTERQDNGAARSAAYGHTGTDHAAGCHIGRPDADPSARPPSLTTSTYRLGMPTCSAGSTIAGPLGSTSSCPGTGSRYPHRLQPDRFISKKPEQDFFLVLQSQIVEIVCSSREAKTPERSCAYSAVTAKRDRMINYEGLADRLDRVRRYCCSYTAGSSNAALAFGNARSTRCGLVGYRCHLLPGA